jgi:hypothetical protein
MLAKHCRHARYVWNLAVEQQQYWQPGRRAPGYNEQCAQLTAARAIYDWLTAGSQTVQQQALRDFAQAARITPRRDGGNQVTYKGHPSTTTRATRSTETPADRAWTCSAVSGTC